MRKINLQMFAWDPNSIVDYLKSTGQDSSYSARKELANSLGISNYSGTGSQNTQMLNALKNSASSNTQKTEATGPATATTPSGTNRVSSNKSSDDDDDEKRTFTQSSTSKKAQSAAKEKLDALDKFDVDNIISQETWDAINTPFNASTAYNDAMKYTNELLAQLSSGKTSYTDQIKDMLNQIQNRDPFSYDMSNDTLFQQSLASAMASGKTAMQDTMGQASALTGGYGSTYATSAANQAYNSYIQEAYNNLPEYYEMAMKAYEMEGNEMYNQLSALNAADASEYERMYNSWNSNFQNAQQMYQNEYTQWQDSVNTAIKNAGLQMDEFSTKYDQAYNTYQANQNYADNLYAQEFNKWSAEEGLDFDYTNLANNNYWKEQELAEEKRQYDSDLALKYAQLAQDQAQFNATLASKNSSGGSSSSKDTDKDSEEKDYMYYVEKLQRMKDLDRASDAEAFDIVMDWMERKLITEDEAYDILVATNTNWDNQGIHKGVMS